MPSFQAIPTEFNVPPLCAAYTRRRRQSCWRVRHFEQTTFFVSAFLIVAVCLNAGDEPAIISSYEPHGRAAKKESDPSIALPYRETPCAFGQRVRGTAIQRNKCSTNAIGRLLRRPFFGACTVICALPCTSRAAFTSVGSLPETWHARWKKRLYRFGAESGVRRLLISEANTHTHKFVNSNIIITFSNDYIQQLKQTHQIQIQT